MTVTRPRWLNFRITLASITVVFCACGPTLRAPEEFTAPRVKQLLFEDNCDLQSYFDTATPEYRQISDMNVSGTGHRAAGQVLYKIDAGAQAKAFIGLLKRLYKRAPILQPDRPLRITVSYQVIANHRSMPINAISTIHDVDGDDVELPYHPCIGAYFFGQRHYAARKRMFSSSN